MKFDNKFTFQAQAYHFHFSHNNFLDFTVGSINPLIVSSWFKACYTSSRLWLASLWSLQCGLLGHWHIGSIPTLQSAYWILAPL